MLRNTAPRIEIWRLAWRPRPTALTSIRVQSRQHACRFTSSGSISGQMSLCPLLGERAALLPWSRIENRAVDFAGCVADEGDPRVIATLDVEFILWRNANYFGRPFSK